MKKINLKSLFAGLLSLLDSMLLRPIPQSTTVLHKKGSVKFSALMVGIKGKIGGTVFQGSKTGFTIKNKPSGNFVKAFKWLFGFPQTQAKWGNDYCTLLELDPCSIGSDGSNTNSIGYLSQQSLITRTSKAWRELTPEQRATWSSAANSFPFTNKWGEQYTGSAFQVFMSINNRILTFSEPLISMAPSASDGDLPSFAWNEMSVEPIASPTTILQFTTAPEKPKKPKTTVTRSRYQKEHAGCLIVVFGLYERGEIEGPSTIELLPVVENLGLNIPAGGTYMITALVYNLKNGHLIFTGTYTQKVPYFENSDLFQWVLAGNYSPPPALSLAPVLDWTIGAFSVALGALSIDSEGDTFGYLIRLLQLSPNEAITFTVGGANSNQFGFFLADDEIVSASPKLVNANSAGTYGNPPLGFSFHPSSIGVQSATITISCSTILTPIVINVTGTGTL